MLPPLPRRGNGRHNIAHPSRHVSLPRIGGRVGPRIVLFEVCSAFTRVAACTLARPPNRGSLIRRLQPLRFLRSCSGASGWSSSPGGPLTHWKAPPYHGARQLRTFSVAAHGCPQAHRSSPSETWEPFLRMVRSSPFGRCGPFFNDDFNVNIRVVTRESIPYSDLTFVYGRSTHQIFQAMRGRPMGAKPAISIEIETTGETEPCTIPITGKDSFEWRQ